MESITLTQYKDTARQLIEDRTADRMHVLVHALAQIDTYSNTARIGMAAGNAYVAGLYARAAATEALALCRY